MVEIFKTDVKDSAQAIVLLELIHEKFCDYQANFDLADPDKILRVFSLKEAIEQHMLVKFLTDLGYSAELLSD